MTELSLTYVCISVNKSNIIDVVFYIDDYKYNIY